VKPQRVCYKLGKTIEQPCSDVLAHTPEVCKGTHLYNGYPAIKDDRDSWGMCTTFAECKTIITAVLTVMSGTDPHKISGTRAGLVELGLVKSVLRSGLCGVIDVLLSRCWGLLRYLEAFGRVITTACCESNPLVSHPCLKLSYHIFLHLLSSHHKST
jgi:hypothetical protein